MYHLSLFILVVLACIKIVSENGNLNTLMTSQSDTENMTDTEIKARAHEIYKNKNIFRAGVKYGTVKNKMPWIDPVIYDDVYKESLRTNLNISNLEKIFT